VIYVYGNNYSNAARLHPELRFEILRGDVIYIAGCYGVGGFSFMQVI